MKTLGRGKAESIIGFFDNLWPNQSGYLRLARGNKQQKIGKTSFFQESWVKWPDDRTKLISLYSKSPESDDYYFCSTLFSQPKASKSYALPVQWLWADLDLADPKSFPQGFPQPTYVIESSPDRYQALWYLRQDIPVADVELYTRGIAYAVGADPSGWDVGQFLRVPCTRNQKYKDSPRITFTLYHRAYLPQEFEPFIQTTDYYIETDEDLQTLIDTAESLNPTELISQYNLLSEAELREKIDAQVAEDTNDRSSRLWALECALARRGLSVPEIASIASISPYNKYSGQQREWKQLIKEAIKAINEKETDQEPMTVEIKAEQGTTRKLVGVSAKELSEKNFPPLVWVVDGILPQQEPLIISATYQSRKTFMALELATSLATGCPFLGHFRTYERGKVLYIQEEMTERQINERMRMICQAREVDYPEEIVFVNQRGFLLDQPSDRLELEEYIKDHKIQYVFFDPLGKQLSRSDINSSNDMSNVTRWLVSLEQKYEVTDVMVHHMNKQIPGRRLTDSISGSWSIPAHYASKLAGALVDNYGRIVKWERKTRMLGENPEIFVTFRHDRDTGAYSTEVQESLSPEEQRASTEIAGFLQELGRDDNNRPVQISIVDLAAKLRITETAANRLVHDLTRQNKCTLYSSNVDGVRTTMVSAPVWTAADIEREFDAYAENNYND